MMRARPRPRALAIRRLFAMLAVLSAMSSDVPAGALGASAAGVMPLVIDDQVLDSCGMIDRPERGATCALWYETAGNASDFGFANLERWDVPAGEDCANSGSSDRSDWIQAGYPDRLDLPAGAVSYLCVDTGHSSQTWSDLVDRLGTVASFPVNDCSAQLGTSGDTEPCPAAPDKYAITGFGRFRFEAVYKGDDPAAIGTPGDGLPGSGTPGACGERASDPNALCLVLEAVTPRHMPDAHIAPPHPQPFVGDDVYGDDGAGQQVSVSLAPGQKMSLRLKIENDGRFNDRFRIDGPGSGSRLTLRYWAKGVAVTAQVAEGVFTTPNHVAGTSSIVRVILWMSPDADGRFERTLVFRAFSVARPRAVDSVSTIVSA